MAKIPLINFNAVKERARLLQFYIEVFDEVPSGSHMIRAYSLMEKIVLDKFAKSEIAPEDKDLMKFDKLKNLALNNANVNERRAAFYKSAEVYMKIAKVEIKFPKAKENETK